MAGSTRLSELRRRFNEGMVSWLQVAPGCVIRFADGPVEGVSEREELPLDRCPDEYEVARAVKELEAGLQ